MSKNTKLVKVTRAQAKEARRVLAEFEGQGKAKTTSTKVVTGVKVGVRKGVRTLRNGATLDVATGKFLSGPVKGVSTGTRRKARKGTTSRRVQTAPKKGQTLFLTQDTRLAFVAAAKKDGLDLRALGVISTRQIAVASVLGKGGVPKGYAPKGFKVGDGYVSMAKAMSKADVKALLNR